MEDVSSEKLLLFLDGNFLGPRAHGAFVGSEEGTVSASADPSSSPTHTAHPVGGATFISLVVTFDANASK